MPSPFITELENARTSQVGFTPIERGGPKGSLVAEIVNAIARTDQQPWRADFRTGTLDTTEDWQAPVTGAGMTIDASTGNLVISTGTTANSESYVRTRRIFSLPVRIQVALSLSQRIANQEFYIELTNATGDVFARWKWDGTGTTSAKVETASGSLAANQTLNTAVSTTSPASTLIYEIDLALDEANFRHRSFTAAGAATERSVRVDNLPHADDALYVQLRAKNLGTAPATSTNFTISHVMVQDVNELSVEVVGGRGNSGANSAVPVAPQALVASTARVGFTSVPGIWQDSTTTPLGASATFTGTSRDLWAAATGVMTASTSSFPKEYRCVAISDVVGTLNLEVSRDSGTTWRRIKAITATTTGTGGLFVAELPPYAPVMRHVRVVYVNGAGAQTHFTLAEAYLAG